MAGRYVILEFDDKLGAEQFLRDEISEQYGAKPLASFLKPKKFCECSGQAKNGGHNNDNWKKHQKYGLYICTRCGKPSTHHQSGILQRLQYVFGFNILEN